MQVKKEQLELDMEQQTVSKLGKEYIKAEYCHPAYLTYMQCWGFFPQDLEMTNLKEQHSDSLLQGLTNLFLQSSLFIEAGTKSLEYMASRARTGLRHNQ